MQLRNTILILSVHILIIINISWNLQGQRDNGLIQLLEQKMTIAIGISGSTYSLNIQGHTTSMLFIIQLL